MVEEGASNAGRLLGALSAFIGSVGTRGNWLEAVPTFFETLATIQSYDRVALFYVHEASGVGLGVSCRIDWASPGLRNLTDNAHPPVRPIEGDPTQQDWAARRSRGEMIEGVAYELDGYLGRYFRENGIVRFLTVPIMVDGRWWGHLCVSLADISHVWSTIERDLLRAAAAIIARCEDWSQSDQSINEATRLAMLNTSVDGIVSINEAGLIIEFNPAAERMFGYKRQDVIGRQLGDTIISARHASAHKVGLTRYIAGGAATLIGRRVETEARRADGEIFPIELTVTEVKADYRRLFTAYIREISDRLAARARLERLAYQDPLTGLPNRTGLLRAVAAGGGVAGGALVLRLPDLAILAASLGDAFIEPLISAIALRLRAVLPSDAILARTGESEFAALFIRPGAVDAAGILLEQAMLAPIETEGRRFFVRGNIGMARTGGPVEPILRNAEMASRAGSGGLHIFNDTIRAGHQVRLNLEIALREALIRHSDEIFPMFQPIRETTTGRVAGFEALARWRHPVQGMISPVEFIPLAEEAGLADSLGDLMLERASSACAQWNRLREGRGLPPRYVSVNLSAKQLSAPDLVPRIIAILQRNGLAGDQVRFELTESTLLSQPVAGGRILQRLQGLGCLIAIDDFGTGYSNLSYLQGLPADVLKLDKSFLNNLEHDLRARKIVSVIVDLAHTLGLTVVAEGVENISTLHEIREAGCDFVQGFLLGRPMLFHDAAVVEDDLACS